MPIYEYEHIGDPSEICSKVFEVFQSMSDEPVTQCPVCDGAVRRIISRVSAPIDRMGAGRLRDAGFKKMVKRDHGVYEAE